MGIRRPVSFLFAVIGVLLMGYGVLGHVARYADYTLDFSWGVNMSVFGCALWLLSRRAPQ